MDAEKLKSRQFLLIKIEIMKFRNMLFASAFLMALTASFAFKTGTNKRFFINATFKDINTCTLGPVDDDCSRTNTGAQCTVYYRSTYFPAYDRIGILGYDCKYPLYHQF